MSSPIQSTISRTRRQAPTPVVVHPSPPSREFIARLKVPARLWLLDYTDAEIKASMRACLAARGTTRARLYAEELARRNTLYALEREHGYAALAGRDSAWDRPVTRVCRENGTVAA